ncbi:MAG TPA: hypothetical protein EYG21_05825 [Nitrospinaceae bacterium]|jgi:hypothetical protein|nr:hypothetical protein [Nitrospinaceae bacterium]
MSTPPSQWVPEICYEEESDGISSHIPFVQVPLGEEMPKILYIFESQETGEHEPGLDGNPVPVIQLDLHQYADLAILKSKFDKTSYDNIRTALGLEPLDEAVEKGQKITETVRDKIEKIPENQS